MQHNGLKSVLTMGDIILLRLMYYPKKKQHYVYTPSEIGRKLNYQQYVTLGNRKHYWGVSNKNIGFYTSDQIEQLEKRIKTEGSVDYYSPYHSKEGRFLINDRNPSIVHCCTCHNNPLRYSRDSDQRCQFCINHKKSKSNMASELSFNNPENQIKKNDPQSRHKELVDEIIQVQLPHLPRHNSKHQESCNACKEKKKGSTLSLPKSYILQRSAKRMLQDEFSGQWSTKNANKRMVRI